MSGTTPMRAMNFFSIAIDAEMVAKVYRLGMATMSEPTNDECENIAVNLLDKALDAALEVCEGPAAVVDLGHSNVKLALVHPLPKPEKPAAKTRKKGAPRR